jgi:hypothetical protein
MQITAWALRPSRKKNLTKQALSGYKIRDSGEEAAR